MQNKPTIAVIGGTGDLGSGLARLWAAAGYSVVLGSRAKDKAEAAARELAAQIGIGVRGDDNRAAAQAADIVVLCVPYSNHDAILDEIKPVMEGKILGRCRRPTRPAQGLSGATAGDPARQRWWPSACSVRA